MQAKELLTHFEGSIYYLSHSQPVHEQLSGWLHCYSIVHLQQQRFYNPYDLIVEEGKVNMMTKSILHAY